MKIIMLSVGKAHDAELRAAIEKYTRRLSHYFQCEWRLLPPAKQTANTAAESAKKAEATTILNSIQKDDVLVLLDECGQQMSSPQLAELLQLQANRSVKTVVFLIGGAFGVDADVKQRANYIWSLSKLVLPHQIVRLILAEQLYRACTILRNEAYHHE